MSEVVGETLIEGGGEQIQEAGQAPDAGQERVSEGEQQVADASQGGQSDQERVEKYMQSMKEAKEIRKYQKQIEQAKAERESLAKEREEYRNRLSEYESIFQNAKKDPDQLLSKAGMDFEYLNDYQLNNKAPTEAHKLDELRAEIQKLREERENDLQSIDKFKQEIEGEKYKKQVDEFIYGLKGFTDDNKEKYQFVSHFGEDGIQQVLATMADVYQESEKSLSNEEALDSVEREFERSFKEMLSLPRARALVQEKFGINLTDSESGSAAAAADSDLRVGDSKKLPGRTLTNEMGRPSPAPKTVPRSIEERYRLAESKLKLL